MKRQFNYISRRNPGYLLLLIPLTDCEERKNSSILIEYDLEIVEKQLRKYVKFPRVLDLRQLIELKNYLKFVSTNKLYRFSV